jgi:hypothetical protein
MIDWASRAAHVLADCPPTCTDETDKTRVSSVSSVGGKGVSFEIEASSGDANQWEVFFPDGRIRVVSFAPARMREEVRRRYPDAVALVEVASTVTSCTRCVHASAYGNCGEPVRAGLAERFMLVKHPDGGVGCAAFEVTP